MDGLGEGDGGAAGAGGLDGEVAGFVGGGVVGGGDGLFVEGQVLGVLGCDLGEGRGGEERAGWGLESGGRG